MNFKQIIIVVFLVALAGLLTALLLHSLKSDTELLKGQVSTLQEFIDSQKKWNQTSTRHDVLLDKRVDMLEQKMRKVYQGY